MKSITRFTKNIRGNECLNCQSPISYEDNFCPNCGQVNDMKKISLAQYFSAYLEDFYSFDNRFFKTVIPLIFKPGFVSKQYVSGKRISYVNPFQLYLQITILFFLILSIFKTIDQYKPGGEKSNDTLSELSRNNAILAFDTIKKSTLKEIQNPELGLDSVTRSNITQEIDKYQTVLQTNDTTMKDSLKEHEKILLQYVDSLIAAPGALLVFKNKNSSSQEKDSVMESMLRTIGLKIKNLDIPGKDVMVDEWSEVGEGWAEISKYNVLKDLATSRIQEILNDQNIDYTIPASVMIRSRKVATKGKLEGALKKVTIFMDYEKKEPEVDVLKALDDLQYEKSYWNVFLYSKSKDWNEAAKDPQNYGKELKDRILSRVSVALFLLLPIFTMIVALLYIRSKFNYTEHLVFVFHTQTVFFIFLLLFIILGRIVNSEKVPWIFLPLFLIYLYMALRAFYKQGWFKTLIKYLMLNFFFVILAAIGGVIISFLAFMI